MNIAVPDTLYEFLDKQKDKRGQLNVSETARVILGEYAYMEAKKEKEQRISELEQA